MKALMLKRSAILCVFAMVCVMMTGCQAEKEFDGIAFLTSHIPQLHIGITHAQEVKTKLGAPSCVLPHDPHTWYYIAHTRSIRALQKPQLIHSQAYAFRFDANQTLRKIECNTLPVTLTHVAEKTPLPIAHNPSFWEKIFGNVGRFSSFQLGAPGV